MSALDDLHAKAKHLLQLRRDRITAGKLEGRHWFSALLQDADSLLLRERAWAARTKDE